ncbi:SDR family oxidoreductase [Rhodoligotrophos defluvii]|uniref:SDR family oxidoreductase n=1 Tax=Rhodoligotrophos defluvii TaxID=2561934 RepID=UPI0010C93A24|nr:SDR family oxidoreductase [Rhodoligotrophos defluvii]
MSDAPRTALVVGALGIVGEALIQQLVSLGDWRIKGISRTAPQSAHGWTHVPLDLTDPEACRTAATDTLADVTHVFYCARYSSPEPREEARINRAMLANLLQPLVQRADALAHICLVHGTKWYGSHLGPYRTPAREDDPRHLGPNFYYDQYDDLLALHARHGGWSWSTVRPHIVCSSSAGYPFNLITLLGAYGSLCASRGLPLDFPGSEACFRSISQATDAGLLARAMVWAATTPASANQSFNIINGDYFRWSGLWPKLADFFGVPMGIVRPMSLARAMADAGADWQKLATQNGLADYPLAKLANWSFGDFLFSAGWDDMSSIVKSRRFGFTDAVDTEDNILEALATLRARRIIP